MRVGEMGPLFAVDCLDTFARAGVTARTRKWLYDIAKIVPSRGHERSFCDGAASETLLLRYSCTACLPTILAF